MGLWDAFTGAAQAKTIKKGSQQAQNALMTGYNTAGGALDTSYDTARGYVDPYVGTGTRYQQRYDDLMGLNGDEARTAAQGVITSDPLWSGQLAQAQNAALRNLNARGLSGSGTAALAGQRVLLENYQNMLNRYQQGGQQGLAASGMGADIASRYGSARAGLDYGNAQQLAGVHQSTANALAQAQGILPQHLMGLASMAISGFTPGWGGTSAFGNMAGGLNKLWGAGAQSAGAQPAQPPQGYYTNPMFSTVPYGGF